MSKDYKIYHRYATSENFNSTVNVTETTGSGELPSNLQYTISDKTIDEVETVFKKKYPIQYRYLQIKFHNKLKKLLKAYESDIP